MTNLFERRHQAFSPSIYTFSMYHDDPITLVSGKGAKVTDSEGREYIDCTAQNLCISVGFAHPKTVEAVSKQVALLPHATTMFQTEVTVAYCEALKNKFPADEDWVVHLVNSGTEAIDLAIMMARAHTGNMDLMTLRNGYHGLQLGAGATTSYSLLRQPGALSAHVFAVHEPNQYRGVFGPGVQPYVDEFARSIFSLSSGDLAGCLVEPIQGFAGSVPMPEGYLAQIAQLTRDAGGVVIVDEVQAGFGRTGRSFWGFEYHQVRPDIVVLGKGIGNGLPIAAVVARREIGESFAKRPFFNTYAFNPIAAVAAHSVLTVIEEEGLEQNVKERGDQLEAGLRELYEKYELVGDVRGEGLMRALEVVETREGKVPAQERAITVGKVLREEGVICVRGGVTRNVFRMNPPMCINKDEITQLLSAMDKALRVASS